MSVRGLGAAKTCHRCRSEPSKHNRDVLYVCVCRLDLLEKPTFGKGCDGITVTATHAMEHTHTHTHAATIFRHQFIHNAGLFTDVTLNYSESRLNGCSGVDKYLTPHGLSARYWPI